MLKALLQAPLCYTSAGVQHGTLKALSGWCPDKRADLKLHFAKTGTLVGADIQATVDTWIAGDLQRQRRGLLLRRARGDGHSRPVVGAIVACRAARGAIAGALLADLKDHAAKRGPTVSTPVIPDFRIPDSRAQGIPWQEAA
jgi:hypothetical protein